MITLPRTKLRNDRLVMSRPITFLYMLTWLSISGCSDSTGPNPVPTADTGSLEVRTATTGASVDPDGYAAKVGRGRQPVGVNAVATIAGLAPGEYDVELIGLTSNCVVSGANPQKVRVVAGETASANFEVACEFVDLAALGKIAFTRGGDIWVMEGHGGNPARLTNMMNEALEPVWSPDGTRIAYTRANDFDPGDIWVVGAGGSNPVNLTDDPAHDFSPTWSPDGTKIAFVREDLTSNNTPGDIWVMDANGSTAVNLTNDPARYLTPVWSPDGTKIAFVRGAFEPGTDFHGPIEIWVMDASGSNAVNLTNDAAADASPAWSPDGTRIAFATDRDGNAEVYVIGADGSNRVNLTNDPAHDFSPAWSPDGAKIAFVRDPGDIWIMDTDGSNAVNLTNSQGAWDNNAVWSSDGSKIAFVSRTADNDLESDLEIWVMDADGSHRANLTNDPDFDDYPAWEPKPK